MNSKLIDFIMPCIRRIDRMELNMEIGHGNDISLDRDILYEYIIL